jgi:hypothetical protein
VIEHSYELYRSNCIVHGVPPLTRRELEMEGMPTYRESQRRSDAYHQMKYDEWARK